MAEQHNRPAEDIRRDLEQLKRAIGSGIMTYTYDGRSVSYRTMAEMQAAAEALNRELDRALQQPRHTTALSNFSRGY